MKTIRIYRLTDLSPTLLRRLKAAQQEAARVWNSCMETHKAARLSHARWPDALDLQHATRGQFALNAQAVQQILRAFLGTIQATRQLRREHPELRMKYPWRTKTFYPVKWPAQAVHREQGRIILPMGKALIVTGRGIRSLKRQRSKQTGQITRKQNRCTRHSRRWKKLQRAKNKVCRRAERRIRDLRHKGTRKGRNWVCRRCGFTGHRDLVGSVNMHQDAFGVHLKFPRSFTYLRPGPLRTRKWSSRAGTPHRCLDQPAGQPHLAEMVSPEKGHRPAMSRNPSADHGDGSVTRTVYQKTAHTTMCHISQIL
jgi:hypothetical protein